MSDEQRLFEKKLNQLSSNFELDLLRLIKTQSFISMTKDVMGKEVNTLRTKSTDFQKKLKEFSIKTIELEEELSRLDVNNTDYKNKYLQNLREILHDCRDYSDVLSKDLNTGLTDNIEKLDSLHRFYLMEMEVFRKELDNRIGILQKQFSDTAKEDSLLSDNIDHDIYNIYDRKVYENSGVNFDEMGLDDIQELSEEDIIVDEIISSSESNLENESDLSGNNYGYFLFFVLLIVAFGLGYYNFDKIDKSTYTLRHKLLNVLNIDMFRNEKESSMNTSFNEDIKSKELDNEILQNKRLDKSSGVEKVKSENINELKTNDGDNPSKESSDTYVITGKYANIRTGPSIYYDLVVTMMPDQKMKSLGEYNGHWLKVRTNDGKEGWISGKLIKKTDPD
ncbi:MAG: SH3 domain-containing protein [Candidatus Dadabacteria bacterium]|nr:SH3 domain-containing protein [Candidatus Dadabacteria bacterium]NIQ16439.1 SH3 domain-containing protein [Candidatus Dadabacteria bacterium]